MVQSAYSHTADAELEFADIDIFIQTSGSAFNHIVDDKKFSAGKMQISSHIFSNTRHHNNE